MSSKNVRDLLVWLHAVTSVAWMSQALALLALLITGLNTSDPGIRLSAYTMAEVLDEGVLLHLANTSIFSGLMLSALTPWGYFRYWWVFTKFVITLSQLYMGIFVLSPRLQALARAAEQGSAGSPVFMIAGSALMVSAIAFQAWLSFAKPWKRTPWAESGGKPKKLPTGPKWMFLFSVGAPVFDYLFGTYVLGFPLPTLMLLTAVAYPFWRTRQLQRSPAYA